MKVLKITLMMRQSERGRVTTTRKMEAKMRKWVHTFDKSFMLRMMLALSYQHI